MAGVWISFCNSHLSVKHLYNLLFSFCEIYLVNSVFCVVGTEASRQVASWPSCGVVGCHRVQCV